MLIWRYYNYLYSILTAIHSFNSTVHFLTLKFAATQFYQRTFFQRIWEHQLNFLSKQLYFQSNIDYTEMRGATWSSFFFAERFFSEYLVVWSSYFFLTTAPWLQGRFLISYFLKINSFSVKLHFWKNFFSRMSNYSEHVLFGAGASSEQLLFQKKNFFRSRYFLKTVTFPENFIA